jgi:hypothetical protein
MHLPERRGGGGRGLEALVTALPVAAQFGIHTPTNESWTHGRSLAWLQ